MSSIPNTKEQIDFQSKFLNFWSTDMQFLDQWSIIWIILAFISLFAVVNQLYLSIGSETYKQRQAFEWAQLIFLIAIPVLSSLLIYHQASSLHPLQESSQSFGILQHAVPAFVLVFILTIIALSLQIYIMIGESSYHRRRLLDIILFIIVFILVAATWMAVQPIY